MKDRYYILTKNFSFAIFQSTRILIIIGLLFLVGLPESIVAQSNKLTYQSRFTGRTTGHIVTLIITNPLNNEVIINAGPYYIPGSKKFQSYVIQDTYPITIPANQTITVDLYGYCTSAFRKPRPSGETTNDIDDWLTINEMGSLPMPDESLSRDDGYVYNGDVIQQTIIPKYSGTHIPFPYTINQYKYPVTAAPLLLEATQQATATYLRMNEAGQINSPWAKDAEKQENSVVQHLIWMYSSALNGKPYGSEHFKNKVLEQIESDAQITFEDEPLNMQNEIMEDISGLWNTFIAVGEEGGLINMGPESDPLGEDDNGGVNCICDFNAKKEVAASVKLAPFVKENWKNLRDKIELKIEYYEKKDSLDKAQALKDILPPKTADEYADNFEKEMKKEDDFSFFPVKGGAMAIADGPAIFGNGSAIAFQKEILGFSISENLYTTAADGKSPLKTGEIEGQKVFTISCPDEDCTMIAIAASFGGLIGKAEVINLTEQGMTDDEYNALKNFIDALPVPEGTPVLGQIMTIIKKISASIKLFADIETWVAADISIHSKDFGMDGKAHLNASTRLSKTNEAEVFDKKSVVNNNRNSEGKKIEGSDVQFESGVAYTSPATITIKAHVEAEAKGLGIGVGNAEMNSGWGIIYICFCFDKKGNFKGYFYGSDHRVLANANLAKSIDEAMTQVQKEVEALVPENVGNEEDVKKEARKIQDELEKILNERVRPIFDQYNK